MQASIYFIVLAQLMGCAVDDDQSATPQAVRVVSVRLGPVVEGRSALAEVVPARSVKVLAQVPGAVAALGSEEGVPVLEGGELVRIAAPDVAARVARVRAERRRAERERDFACELVGTDRALAEAGDLASFQLDRSEKSCAAATHALEAARAAAREAGVAGSRSLERAPFDGVVLSYLVDVGQTVMPGTPLAQFGSQARQLRLRLAANDLVGVEVGTPVHTALGEGQVVEIGAQAQGPGRLVEVLAALDVPLDARPGTTLSVSLVRDAWPQASAVPAQAIGEDEGGRYVLVVRDAQLERLAVRTGPEEDGWVAVSPNLDPGTLVVSGGLAALDLGRPVLAVTR